MVECSERRTRRSAPKVRGTLPNKHAVRAPKSYLTNALKFGAHAKRDCSERLTGLSAISALRIVNHWLRTRGVIDLNTINQRVGAIRPEASGRMFNGTAEPQRNVAWVPGPCHCETRVTPRTKGSMQQ